MDAQTANYVFITPQSDIFPQILDLRFEVFFQPFNFQRGGVADDMDDNSWHLVALQNGNVLGYVRLTILETDAQISQMVVGEIYRKLGLGSELLKRITAKALELHINKLTLNSRLKAIKFYEKLGFKSVGEVFSSPKTHLLHMKMEKLIYK